MSYTHAINSVKSLVHRRPGAIISLSAFALVLPWMLGNYQKYLSLGIGGMPYNPFGWFLSTLAKPFAKETTSVDLYEKDKDQREFLDKSKIKERRGSRPKTGWHCLPHRQVEKQPSAEMCKCLDDLFASLAAQFEEQSVATTKISPHERHGLGLVIHPSLPSPHPKAAQSLREIFHVHNTDHSMHIMLSPRDCATLISLGYGERHPLSGVAPVVPLPYNYIMLYAPRDAEELDVIEMAIKAAVSYMTEGAKAGDVGATSCARDIMFKKE